MTLARHPLPSRSPLHHSLWALRPGGGHLPPKGCLRFPKHKSHLYALAHIVPTSCPVHPPFSVWKILTLPLRLSFKVASAEASLTLPGRTGHCPLPPGALPQNAAAPRHSSTFGPAGGVTVCLHGSVSPAPSPGRAHTSNSSVTKIKLAGEVGWHGKGTGVGVSCYDSTLCPVPAAPAPAPPPWLCSDHAGLHSFPTHGPSRAIPAA